MKYSTQILLFVVFMMAGLTGYYAYQIYMDEQDVVQSNIVYSINTTAIEKIKNPAEFKRIEEVNTESFLKMVELRQNAALVMANVANLYGFSLNDILVGAFKYYMEWIGKGVSLQKLSSGVVKDLSPYYDAEKCDLNKVTFGFSKQLIKLNSPHLGLTYVYKIYFGDESYKNRLKNTTKISKLSDEDIYWIAHELVHCEQYSGKIDKYATTWFNQVMEVIKTSALNVLGDLFQALFKGALTGNFSDVTKVLSPQNLAKYDDNMDLEQEASNRGNQIVNEIRDKETIKAGAIMIKPGTLKAPAIEVQ